jgi:hypothetical protein
LPTVSYSTTWHCASDRAFDVLRERALLRDQTLEYTALNVLDDIVRFDL